MKQIKRTLSAVLAVAMVFQMGITSAMAQAKTVDSGMPALGVSSTTVTGAQVPNLHCATGRELLEYRSEVQGEYV